jgi:hypothetical protein
MNELWTSRNTAFEKTISATTLRPSDKDIVPQSNSKQASND